MNQIEASKNTSLYLTFLLKQTKWQKINFYGLYWSNHNFKKYRLNDFIWRIT